MLLGRILRAVLIGAVATLALGGCRPAAQDNPLPLIVHVLPAQEGLQIEVPLCRGDVVVSATVVSSLDAYRDARWIARPDSELPERTAVLRFSRETLNDASFNPDELKPLKEDDRGAFGAPSEMSIVQVTTSRGTASLKTHALADGAVALWVVRGNDTPTPITEDAARTVLDGWCRGASAS